MDDSVRSLFTMADEESMAEAILTELTSDATLNGKEIMAGEECWRVYTKEMLRVSKVFTEGPWD